MGTGNFDLVGIEALLSDEERLARDSIKRFVVEEIDPIIAECFEKGEFPSHLIPRFGELGMLGANLPEKYGCAGMNNVAYGLVMQELEGGDSGLRSFASVQGALCMYPIFQFGSEEQRQRFLPDMATGKIIGCFGLTEPNFGSNPSGMVTRADRVKDGWMLNGSKAWITNGSIADLAIVWAKVGDRVRGFLVEKGLKGLRRGRQSIS